MDTEESSGIDSPDNMNSSSEHILSPPLLKLNLQNRRKLNFSESPENDRLREEMIHSNVTVSPKKQPSMSPPYRRVRSLR
jgi:hypothetical protein